MARILVKRILSPLEEDAVVSPSTKLSCKLRLLYNRMASKKRNKQRIKTSIEYVEYF